MEEKFNMKEFISGLSKPGFTSPEDFNQGFDSFFAESTGTVPATLCSSNPPLDRNNFESTTPNLPLEATEESQMLDYTVEQSKKEKFEEEKRISEQGSDKIDKSGVPGTNNSEGTTPNLPKLNCEAKRTGDKQNEKIMTIYETVLAVEKFKEEKWRLEPKSIFILRGKKLIFPDNYNIDNPERIRLFSSGKEIDISSLKHNEVVDGLTAVRLSPKKFRRECLKSRARICDIGNEECLTPIYTGKSNGYILEGVKADNITFGPSKDGTTITYPKGITATYSGSVLMPKKSSLEPKTSFLKTSSLGNSAVLTSSNSKSTTPNLSPKERERKEILDCVMECGAGRWNDFRHMDMCETICTTKKSEEEKRRLESETKAEPKTIIERLLSLLPSTRSICPLAHLTQRLNPTPTTSTPNTPPPSCPVESNPLSESNQALNTPLALDSPSELYQALTKSYVAALSHSLPSYLAAPNPTPTPYPSLASHFPF